MKRIPAKLQPWFEARRKLGLSHATVQMARELGMNPKKLGKLVPVASQQWKAPLPEFIAHCYEKRHGHRVPEQVRSLEQIIEDKEQRKDARRLRKAVESAAQSESQQSELAQVHPHNDAPD